MSNGNNFLDNELIFNKRRKLEKGKEEENYTELTIRNNINKSQPLLRRRISDSEFNFNVPSSALNHSLIDSWEPLSNEAELISQYQKNTNEFENGGNEKIVVNEPPDVPIIEEFDDKNEIYPFFNSHTLQYEFTPDGIIKDGNTSFSYNNNFNYRYSLPEIGTDDGGNGNIHRHESSLVPFKQDSQVILFNNNSTGQVVLYNKANKSLSIHKVRPNPKNIMPRNKRCILCNQLLPSERERMNTNNMFKNRQAYTDAKYFRLLACSLNYARKPSLTDANNSGLNGSTSSPIHTVNSAENIVNLLNDNSNSSSEYMNHPALTLTNPHLNLNIPSNENSNVNLNKDGIKEVNEVKTDNEKKSSEGNISDQNNREGNSTTNLSKSSFNNGYYERFFIERKKLGRGFRGSVFLCHHVLDQVFLGEYAIKKVAVGNNHQWLVRMLKEVMLLEKLRNPNIIEYKHAWLEEHRFSLFGPKVPCLFILMERANGGNLEEYVQLQWNPEEQFEKTLSVKERIKRKRLQMKAAQNQIRDNRAQFFGGIGYDSFGKRVRYLTTEAIWKIFLDICYGLNHLHDLGIIHRDLKPPNLLLQYNDPNNQEEIPKVLISDFGECEILSHIEKRQRTGATGTLEFMAELLMSDETGHYYDDYSSNSDLWSLGVVLYYICFSEMPYSQVDDIDILKNEILNYSTVHFKNDNNSNRVPKELKSLIKKLMVKEPTKRPKAKEILKLYGGYKNGTSIRIDTNEDLAKNSSNQNSPSGSSSSLRNLSSNESISNSKKIDDKPIENDKIQNDNNINNKYLSPYQNTSISKSKLKGKEKIEEKEKEQEKETNNENMNVNKNEHNHKNENENENKLENNRIKKNESNNKNENKVKEKKVEKEEEEWLNKELVDEPLTFKAEKRIVPFNHNRSKSLSFLQNSSKSNQYSKYHISNNNSMIQNSIKEEGNEISNNNKEFNDYPNEKSLVPFHNTRKNLDRRPLPSLTYSPLKNNEKEKIYSNENYALKEYNDDNAIDGKEYSKELVIKRIKGGLNHHENRKRIEVVPFNSIKYLVKRSISTPKHQSIWDIIIKKINLEKLIKNINNLFYRDFQNSPKQKKIKNRKRIQSVKGKNNKKSFPYQPRRHTYQNSKIYFTHLPNQKNVIETKFHSRNLYGKREELKKINPPEKQLTTFKPYYSQLKINQYNQLINTIKQKTIILNMILFLLKVYLLYQVLYPHKLFFVVALLLIIYNSNILRFNIFRFLAYSILDISFIYFVKIFYILYHGK